MALVKDDLTTNLDRSSNNKSSSIVTSSWDTSSLLKRSISFDKSTVLYEDETLREGDWKRCKVALIGEICSPDRSHPEAAPVSTIKVNGGTSNCRRSVEDRVLYSPPSNGLKLIQSAYADSDTSSSAHSPSPTPNGWKPATLERSVSSDSSVYFTPNSSLTPSRCLLNGTNEPLNNSVGKQQYKLTALVDKNEINSTQQQSAIRRNGLPEGSCTSSNNITGNTSTIPKKISNPSNGTKMIIKNLLPRSALLATNALSGTRSVNLTKQSNRTSTNGNITKNSTSSNRLDGSVSYNVVFGDDSQLESPSITNGYVHTAVIDSAKASTSKVSMIGPVKPSSSGTPTDALKQNGTTPKETMKNGSSKATRKRVLSERGEAEAKYPVIDRKTLFNSWRGSRLLQPNGRNSGVGLFNYSNDCFLNAVLQAMVHTAPLARYVAESHSCGNYSNSCFACAMGEHVRRAITSSGPFKAQWIQPYLKKIFPSHKPGYQEDAHELLSLILDALDPAPPTSSKQTNGSSSSTPNQFRELRPSTPMEQMFGGALRNEIRCFGCGENYINYERIRELNLGLRMRKREGIISLNDLFADYFNNETLNSFDCKKCKRKTQAQRVTRMIRAPHVLIVQLKRFNAFGCKIRLPITVEMNVKLDRFMYQIDDRNSYSLCSLIEHQGDGIDRGHYIAFVRGFDGKGWHCFDDESCQRVSVDEVRKRQGYVMIYTRSEQSPENNLTSCSTTLSVQQRFNNKHRFPSQSATSLVTTAHWHSTPTAAVAHTNVS